MKRSVIVSYARTPFGKFGGSLKEYSAVSLGAEAIRGAVSRAMWEDRRIDEVIIGQVLSGGCGQIPARQAALAAGIPDSVPVEQINKVCASGFRAVTLADQIIRCGDAVRIVAGGMESMSNAPYISRDVRWGHKMFNVQFEDLMVKDGLWCPCYNRHMAEHGGEIAKEYKISRKEQDTWAMRSQKLAAYAQKAGFLDEEIIPVGEENLTEDEAIRRNITEEQLEKLQPLFSKENTVTAGNAPGVNDGAAALCIMDERVAEEEGCGICAVIVSSAMHSEDPKNIATAPGNTINKLLKKNDLKDRDIGLYEINEAFAAVTLVSGKIVGCDMDKVNVSGGAIAYGHPIAASGGRIIMRLASEMKRRNVKYGIAAICSGVGQGDAILLENPYV